MVTRTGVSHVFPMGSRVNEHGRLEVGGCDTVELAREYGTPAYVVAEDDLRARARAFLAAGAQAGQDDFQVVFASKSFPCTAVLRLFVEEGLWCDVASGGELHLALHAGFPARRILVHGNAKSLAELRMAVEARVGLIAIDNFEEIERLAGLVDEQSPQPVLLRVTPDVRGETHEKISTGQADSKFGFSVADVPEALARVGGVGGLRLQGLHAHIGSQLFDLEPIRRAAAALGEFGPHPVWDLGGGLGVAYTEAQRPPEIEEYVAAVVDAARAHGLAASSRLMVEPGRSLTANAAVTLYTVESVKRNVSTWVAVDGGMSDNLRPMLYGAPYEAHVADRLAPGAYAGGADASDPTAERLTDCVLAGKHCESGDVIVRRALLRDPRAGDVIVTPATGAYGFAMASNYNGVPRPPVIFCKDGDARVVVRRESYEDLSARDVL